MPHFAHARKCTHARLRYNTGTRIRTHKNTHLDVTIYTYILHTRIHTRTQPQRMDMMLVMEYFLKQELLVNITEHELVPLQEL